MLALLYILFSLLFGFVCFIAGAVWYGTRTDGLIKVKQFNDDGTVMFSVKLNLTMEEFEKRRFVSLRCI